MDRAREKVVGSATKVFTGVGLVIFGIAGIVDGISGEWELALALVACALTPWLLLLRDVYARKGTSLFNTFGVLYTVLWIVYYVVDKSEFGEEYSIDLGEFLGMLLFGLVVIFGLWAFITFLRIRNTADPLRLAIDSGNGARVRGLIKEDPSQLG